MYGGDEVSSLVFDIGSFNSRFGYSGEDTPRFVFQSQIGLTKQGITNKVNTHNVSSTENEANDINMKIGGEDSSPEKNIFFGENELRYFKSGMKVVNPINNQGYIENYDLFENLLSNVYSKFLRTESKEHPVLFSEPAIHNKDFRVALASHMFEKFEVPALFVAKNPVLSAFSCGRSTCLVFDSGHNYSTATPVHDGYALQKSLIRHEVGGNYVIGELEKILNEKNTKIVPHYKFTKERASESDPFVTNYLPEESVLADPSYENFWTKEIIRDMKESSLSIYEDNLLFNKDVQVKPIQYELPDGTSVELKNERVNLLEKLFNPIKEIPGFSGYHSMIADSINKGDIDIKKEMFSNIFLCGGNSLFQGFSDRLQKQISNCSPPNVRVKIYHHQTTSERRFSSWTGGSILSSLGTFHQIWFSKQEYEEHGAVLIERKCA